MFDTNNDAARQRADRAIVDRQIGWHADPDDPAYEEDKWDVWNAHLPVRRAWRRVYGADPGRIDGETMWRMSRHLQAYPHEQVPLLPARSERV